MTETDVEVKILFYEKNVTSLLHILEKYWCFLIAVSLIVLFRYFSTEFFIPLGVLFQKAQYSLINLNLQIYRSINLGSDNRML